MANQAVAQQQKKLKFLVDKSSEIIMKQAVTLQVQQVNPQVFANALGNALIASPGLANCKPESVFAGIRNAIRDGIVPDGREGALVANRDGSVMYLPMKEGLSRAFCSKTGASIRSGVIFENDEVLELDVGTNPVIRIKPCILGDRGAFLAAWAMVKMPDGETYGRVMNKDEVDRARAKSRAKAGPWSVWYERMAEKCVIKSLLNSLRHLIPRNEEAVKLGEGDVGIESMLLNDPEYEGEIVQDDGPTGEDATVVDVDPNTGEVIGEQKPEEREREPAKSESKPAKSESTSPKSGKSPRPGNRRDDPPPEPKGGNGGGEFDFDLPD